MILQWILPSSFLILIILTLRAVLGNRISARFRYALWALVLVRLLVPVQLFTLPVTGNSIPAIPNAAAPPALEKAVNTLPVQPVPVEENRAASDAASFADSPDLPEPESNAERSIRYTYAGKTSPAEALQILWVIGGAAFALIVLLSNLHFSVCLRRVRKPVKEIDCQIPIYRMDNLPSPCLFGVLKPAIYMTARTAETPDMLRHVLVHELTHYRHLDHIWSVLRGLALAVHWWNPLVWLAVVLSRRDGELACDEGALKLLGRGERTAYGETLLALVTAKLSPRDLFSCATTMSGERRSLRERIRRIACEPKQFASATIAVVMIAVLASACSFGKPAEIEPSVVSPQRAEEPDPESGYDMKQPVLSSGRKEGVYTFLLVGTDNGSGNADTLMVISYDAVHQEMSVMSVPRDIAVNDGQEIKKIGMYTASSGNMDALQESVRKLIGFKPDYYVKADLNICAQLVDLIGGVMFDVPQDMDYDDPYQNLYIHLQKGPQMLDGERAMGLVRFRRYVEGDIKRVAVQQDFMKALLKECLSLENWDKVTGYISLALENVETDLEPASIAWFASNMLGLNDGVPAFNMDDVYTCTLPGDYLQTIMSDRGLMTVAVSYPEQVAQLVNERFNPYRQEITVSMLDEVMIPSGMD